MAIRKLELPVSQATQQYEIPVIGTMKGLDGKDVQVEVRTTRTTREAQVAIRDKAQAIIDEIDALEAE